MGQLDRFRKLLGFGSTASAPVEPKKQPVSVRGLRVLVIDDSRTILVAMERMLSSRGLQVLTAPDGETGIEIAQAEKPDLIFLDIVLPGLNGFGALRKLRRMPETEKTPVIMISGNPQATEQFYLERIGADGFLKKPFGRHEIDACIERLLETGALKPLPGSSTENAEQGDSPSSLPDSIVSEVEGEMPVDSEDDQNERRDSEDEQMLVDDRISAEGAR